MRTFVRIPMDNDFSRNQLPPVAFNIKTIFLRRIILCEHYRRYSANGFWEIVVPEIESKI